MCKELIQIFTPPVLNEIILPHLQDCRLSNAYDKALKNVLKFNSDHTDTVVFLWQILNHIHTDTAQHSLRVARIAYLLAESMPQSELPPQTMFLTVLIHDIGKVDPDFYPHNGHSTNRKHTNIGAEIAERLGFSNIIVQTILHHHQKSGKNISLMTQIIRYADIFDRYLSYLKSNNNLQNFDPRNFRRIIKRKSGSRCLPAFNEMYNQHKEEIFQIYEKPNLKLKDFMDNFKKHE